MGWSENKAVYIHFTFLKNTNSHEAKRQTDQKVEDLTLGHYSVFKWILYLRIIFV